MGFKLELFLDEGFASKQDNKRRDVSKIINYCFIVAA